MQKTFSENDISKTDTEYKIGLLATLNEQNQPHITLISTLQAISPTQISWGQFTEGLSKKHIAQNPKAGFLILSLDKNIWYGKAKYTHTQTAGPEYQKYNDTPMFRYNAYFGVHTVYYMDLVEQSGEQALPMPKIIQAAVKTMLLKYLTPGNKQAEPVMSGWARKLMDKLSNLKFLSYVDSDGFPKIVPVIQTQSLTNDIAILSQSVYSKELSKIDDGQTVALFSMSFDMESFLIRGQFNKKTHPLGFKYGEIKADWAYNTMPPVPQQIYPMVSLEAITKFE